MNTRPSIDVHGMTRDQAISTIRMNLLYFYNTGFPEVHIVHGHGQGILKAAVRDMLRTVGFVKSLRKGKDNEGGDGVTVAIFK
jgi:DNA mismatch repair protein MutS2